MTSRAPVYILNQNSKREQGRKAQAANIKAAKVPLFQCLTAAGRVRHREDHFGPQVHAQDAPGPNGRYRAYQRRQRHPQRGTH